MGGGLLATLTQLVRLIKRVHGPWARAQTHQETVRPIPPKTLVEHSTPLHSQDESENVSLNFLGVILSE